MVLQVENEAGDQADNGAVKNTEAHLFDDKRLVVFQRNFVPRKTRQYNR